MLKDRTKSEPACSAPCDVIELRLHLFMFQRRGLKWSNHDELNQQARERLRLICLSTWSPTNESISHADVAT